MNDKNVHLGDGILDEAKTTINMRSSELVTDVLNILFDYLKGKIPNLPTAIKKILTSPQTKKEISSLYSENLFRNGLIPKGYCGLPDEALIDNFHQDGYIEGLYVGYKLAMKALIDNGAERELVLSVRDDMRPKLLGHHYNDSKSILDLCNEEKYSWVEKCEKIE